MKPGLDEGDLMNLHAHKAPDGFDFVAEGDWYQVTAKRLTVDVYETKRVKQ